MWINSHTTAVYIFTRLPSIKIYNSFTSTEEHWKSIKEIKMAAKLADPRSFYKKTSLDLKFQEYIVWHKDQVLKVFHFFKYHHITQNESY